MLAAASCGRYSLFAGGFGPKGDSDTVDIFDAETQTWNVSHLSEARGLMAATSFGSEMAFFAGGQFRNGTKSDAVDVFHAKTKSWTVMKLSVARSMLAAASADGPNASPQYALFAGGELVEKEGNTSVSDDTPLVDIYDAFSQTWSKANLTIGKKKFAATSFGRQAIFAGGYLSHHGSLASVDIFDGLSGKWTTANLSASRMRLEATSVGSRAFFVSGMGDICGGHCPEIDIYDYSSKKWSAVNLTNGRYEHTVAALNNDTLIVSGGKQSGSPWNLTEVLRSDGSWSHDYTAEPRSYHVSVTVPSMGMVLIAGGDFENGTMADLVECYMPWETRAATIVV